MTTGEPPRLSWRWAAAALVLAACGSAPGEGASTITTITAAPTTSQFAATTVPAPAPTVAPAPATVPPQLVPVQLAQVGAASQALVVTAPSYGATTATLTAWERGAEGWRAVFGPWTVDVGSRGFAPPGEKREGDRRTPSGTYGFDFMFGTDPDPGVALPYRRVTPSIVWDDDPASPSYNQWIDLDRQPSGVDPEPMYVGAYRYGAVIAYNAARTPGLGSAIFLHVSTGGATAGCVSLPADQLLALLRWLHPSRQPQVVMGVA